MAFHKSGVGMNRAYGTQGVKKGTESRVNKKNNLLFYKSINIIR